MSSSPATRRGRAGPRADPGAPGNADGAGTAATFTFESNQPLAISTSGVLYVRTGTAIRSIGPDATVRTVASNLTLFGSSAIAVDRQAKV